MNNIFKQLNLVTLLIEGMNTILIDQMSTYVVLKKYILGDIKIFNNLPRNVAKLKTEKAVALRKYLSTHPFYPVD